MRDWIGGALIFVFLLLTSLQIALRHRMANSDVEPTTPAAKIAVKEPLPAPIAQNGNDWPMWRGPMHDGIVRESILESWPENGPKKLWDAPTGDGYSSVAVSGGVVYAFFQNNNEETLVALDSLTGKERWRFAYADRYVNTYGDGPRSTPTVDGDRVYIVGGNGVLHCVDVKTGTKRWRKDLLVEFKAPTPQWGISFSPLVDGDNLIVCPGGEDGGVVALNKFTGDVVWKSLHDAGGYSSPLIADIAGRRQLIAFTAKGLVGLDPADGELLWRYPWKTPWNCNVTTPIVAGDYLFITSGYDRGCALVHVKQGDKAFIAERVFENTKMCSHFASCIRFGETLYGFNESTLVAMELRTGKIKWKERGIDGGAVRFGKGSLLGVGDKLMILTETGTCVIADVSSGKLTPIASFSFSSDRCWTVPVISHGLLYLRDQKTLACFDVRSAK